MTLLLIKIALLGAAYIQTYRCISNLKQYKKFREFFEKPTGTPPMVDETKMPFKDDNHLE